MVKTGVAYLFFFDEKTRCLLFVAAILDNTLRGGAKRAVVDKRAMRREGAEGAKRERECMLENYPW